MTGALARVYRRIREDGYEVWRRGIEHPPPKPRFIVEIDADLKGRRLAHHARPGGAPQSEILGHALVASSVNEHRRTILGVVRIQPHCKKIDAFARSSGPQGQDYSAQNCQQCRCRTKWG